MSTCCCVPLGFLAASNVSAGGGGGGDVALQNVTVVTATTTASSFNVSVNVGNSGPRLFVLGLGTTRSGSSALSEVSTFEITANIGGTAMTQPVTFDGTGWNNAAFTQGGRLEQRYIEEGSLTSSQTLSIAFSGIGGVSGTSSFSAPVTHSIVFAVFTLDSSFGYIQGFVGVGLNGTDSKAVGTTAQTLFFGSSMARVAAGATPTWGGAVLSPNTLTPSSWVFDNCKMSFGYQVTAFTGVNSSDVSINWNTAADYMWVGSNGTSP